MMDQFTYEGEGTLREAVPIDWGTPDAILMEMEEDGQPETIDLDGISAIPRDALLTILRYIIPAADRGSRWRVATYRLAALAHLAGLQGVAESPQTKLAAELGITRAALSHWMVKIVDELEQAQSRKGKCRHAREVYRQSATAAHARRKAAEASANS